MQFLGQVLVVDGQKLRRRLRQESDHRLVQLARQLAIIARLARQRGRQVSPLE